MLTVPELLVESANNRSSHTAICKQEGQRWVEINWRDHKDNVAKMVSALQRADVKKGDKVLVMMATSYNWMVIDLAVLSIGAITVPVFPTASTDEFKTIVAATHPVICFFDSSGLHKKVNESGAQIKKAIIANAKPENELSLSQFVNGVEPIDLDTLVQDRSLDEIATIVFTSGSTGEPRGVVLTHQQLRYEIKTFQLVGMKASDRSMAFLPFAHVLGRIEIWGHCLVGYTISFGQRPELIKDNLGKCRPTIICTVPRFFEKIYSAISAVVKESKIKKTIFDQACSVANEYFSKKLNGMDVSRELQLKYFLVEKLFFEKIRKGLGGRLKYAVCGGAKLDSDLTYFFAACGITILEGYGLSETTAAVTVNTPMAFKPGSVGRPIGDTDIRLAEDGEILVKSPMVMKGYLNQGAAEEWFATGDIGRFDEDGFLYITDRKKEMIKLSNGKYVAPQKNQMLIKRLPLVSDALIIGEGRKYVSALIAPQPTVKDFNDFDRQVRNHLDEINRELSSHEMIKKYHVLKKEFSVDHAEVTHSFKLRRHIIEDRYRDEIESMYKAIH